MNNACIKSRTCIYKPLQFFPSLTNEPICLLFQRNPLCSYILIGNCVHVKSLGLAPGTGKNNRFPFLDILGYLKNTHKNPKFGRWDKSQSGNLARNSRVGACLTLPNLGFLRVFFEYPKISKNGNLLFFPVGVGKCPAPGQRSWNWLMHNYENYLKILPLNK